MIETLEANLAARKAVDAQKTEQAAESLDLGTKWSPAPTGNDLERVLEKASTVRRLTLP